MMSSTRSDTASSIPALGAPWVGSESYWQPVHRPLSAWVEHAPFAFWLVSQLRPASVVELGTHWGYSYFVFCEAMRRLGIDGTVSALDTWVGEDHAGLYGEEVYDYVAEVTRASYPGIGRMVRGYFADSVGEFGHGSVDLLHIDGRHGYEDVVEDFTTYLPTLSERAVVLFHDVAEHRPNFGVWRFWDEISQQYPSFLFPHNHGLGVLAVGPSAPESVRALTASTPAETERIRSDYAALGAEITRVVEAEKLAAGAQKTRDELEAEQAGSAALTDERDALLERLAEAGAETERLTAEAADLRSSTSWRITRPLRWAGSFRGRA